MSDGHRTLGEAEALAKARGCVIVYPKPNELFIDVDSAADMVAFEKSFEILKKEWPESKVVRKTSSSSGRPWRFHFVVDMGCSLSELERIALQACLGSDRTRELLSFIRWDVDHDPSPTIFFEKERPVEVVPSPDEDLIF